jgi:hypothetical protein
MKSDLRPSDPGESPAKVEERRAHPRIPAEELPGLSARLAPDTGIRLIDISKGGALFECRKRVVPGSEVALRLMTQDGSHLVRGRVVRSRMIRLENGTMGYQTAIAFSEALKDFIPEPETTPADAGANEDLPIRRDAAPPDDLDESWSAMPVILFTATIGGTSDELREMFSHNDW